MNFILWSKYLNNVMWKEINVLYRYARLGAEDNN